MKTRSLQTLPTSGKFGGIAFLLMLGFALSARAQTPPHYEPTLESLNQHPLPQWYADAKLGIFVHWGLYSVPGWAPLVHPEHDFRTPDYIKNNPYAEWYLNVMRIDGSPTQAYHREHYGADYDYYNFASVFDREIQKWNPDAWARNFPGRRREICSPHHQTSRRIYPVAQLNAEPQAACRPAARYPRYRRRFDHGREQGGAADGSLLFRRL